MALVDVVVAGLAESRNIVIASLDASTLSSMPI